MTQKEFSPVFQTPLDEQSREEKNKRSALNAFEGNLAAEFRDPKPDIGWEAEQLAKSHGIYLEFNRARSGSEKDWIYMIRVSNPGGGPLGADQWRLLDELSERHGVDPEGRASLRLTTRQNIQFHWVKKAGVLEIVKKLAESDLRTLNGCGDNTRNVMACPLSRRSPLFDAHAWARRTADYFQLPLEPFIRVFAIDPAHIRKPESSFSYGPQLLNRKFKMAFTCLHRDAGGRVVPDNCVEALTNDLAVAPLLEEGVVRAFQVYVGGGQGEKNVQLTTACLGRPLGIVDEARLLKTLDAVVAVHQDWGDRKSRHWARLKYVIRKQGIDWFRDRVQERAGFRLEAPRPEHDHGAIQYHHGWSPQPDGRWAHGLFIENGRVIDGPDNGPVRSLVRDLAGAVPASLFVTPNQDLIFTDIMEGDRRRFDDLLTSRGYGLRRGRPFSTLRRGSGACVGHNTCRMSYTDSERFEPWLMDELESMGWGELATTVGVTGCERQCFRPATKAVGLVGTGNGRYMVKLFGTEDGRHQGTPLVHPATGRMHLRMVPRDRVAGVLDALFRFHREQARPDESFGYFNRRQGAAAIIGRLSSDPAAAGLMEDSHGAENLLDPPY